MKNFYLNNLYETNEKVSHKSVKTLMYSFKGIISIEGDVQIYGQFTGRLDVKGDLTVCENSLIIGEIMADNITFKGRMNGVIKAKSRVLFLKGSVFSGSINADTAEFSKECITSGSRCLGHGYLISDN